MLCLKVPRLRPLVLLVKAVLRWLCSIFAVTLPVNWPAFRLTSQRWQAGDCISAFSSYLTENTILQGPNSLMPFRGKNWCLLWESHGTQNVEFCTSISVVPTVTTFLTQIHAQHLSDATHYLTTFSTLRRLFQTPFRGAVSALYLTPLYKRLLSYWGKRELRFGHSVDSWVLCGSENKQRLFHYTALTDWFL